MSNIHQAFENGPAFIGFVTGGDPTIDICEQNILEMIRAGADLVEIGIPFSDPIAEGPVIQRANLRALSSGANIHEIFDMVRRLRKVTTVPMVFLTYLNPVFHYGYEAFFAQCKQTGVDGIIIPDLPLEERNELHPIAAAHSVDLIAMVAPTSQERIRAISQNATGFLYVVSSMGVTGVRDSFNAHLKECFDTIKAHSNTPAAIGFGIHSHAQAAEIAKYADGVIVGSAIVKLVEEHGAHAPQHIYEYVKQMKHAITSARSC